jgi:hypothetical protein
LLLREAGNGAAVDGLRNRKSEAASENIPKISVRKSAPANIIGVFVGGSVPAGDVYMMRDNLAATCRRAAPVTIAR